MDRGSLVIVFDDGYTEDYEQVRPVLQKRGVPACLAIVPEWIGSERHLSADQLDDLVHSGWEVAAHGRRHRYLLRQRLAKDAEAGDERVFLRPGHVYPGESHGVYAGDDFAITDGETGEVCELSGTGVAQPPYVELTRPLTDDYAADAAVLRPTPTLLEDEIVGVRDAFRDLGYDPSTFVFPYDAGDVRAWSMVEDHYDVLANAAVRSLPNPPETSLTNLRRFYLETDSMTTGEVGTYLDRVAEAGEIGVLAGHAAWETVPPERVAAVVDAALDRGIEVTTFEDLRAG